MARRVSTGIFIESINDRDKLLYKTVSSHSGFSLLVVLYSLTSLFNRTPSCLQWEAPQISYSTQQ